MLKLDEFVDVIVPRGGKGLIERVSRETRIPVIKHLDGICHVYIDSEADPNKVIDLAFNSKAEKLQYVMLWKRSWCTSRLHGYCRHW